MINNDTELAEARNAIFILADALPGSTGAKERDVMIQQVDEYEYGSY